MWEREIWQQAGNITISLFSGIEFPLLPGNLRRDT
jgi:hypothetical protein